MLSPVRLSLAALGNTLLVAGMAAWLPQYLTILGGAAAYVILGCLLTLLNLFLRPLLALITLPLWLVLSAVTSVGINLLFLAIVHAIVLRMDPSIVILVIRGGLIGYLVLSTILGIGNWIMHRW